ncbi:MAG: P1 family peptidase [Nitritalea sp.]
MGQQHYRDYGLSMGVMAPGPGNRITDVAGVRVGHQTRIEGDSIRTGVTAILPHGGNIFREKVPAAIYVGNGFGKLAGLSQVQELGNLETPILLTNTLAVGPGIEAAVRYTLAQPGNEAVQSVNAVVGETNDGYLNAIQQMPLSGADFLAAIQRAGTEVEEGNVGAGTGTMAFGFKGGIGTASRQLPASLGGFTVGVLVQSNFGGVLAIDGKQVGRRLSQYSFRRQLESADGSCMIVVATDAPLSARNLERLAKRAMLGLARTGGIASNGSGDYVIAFSTAPENRIAHQPEPFRAAAPKDLPNDGMSPLFLAVIEATEEAIINSLFMAAPMEGRQQRRVEALPVETLLPFLRGEVF